MSANRTLDSLDERNSESVSERNSSDCSRALRLLWITGGKGGVGKSTLARALAHILPSAGVNVALFDGDPENAQLFRFYQNVGDGVVRTPLAKRDGCDDILAVMDEQRPGVVLVDAPAGGSQILLHLQEESGFLSEVAALGYAVTVVTVITPVMDSVNMVVQALATTEGHEVQQVVVKNLFFGQPDDFDLFDESKTKVAFDAADGVVLLMRDLLGKTFTAIDKKSLSFEQALSKQGGVPYGDRARLKQWLTHLSDQVRAVPEVFGL